MKQISTRTASFSRRKITKTLKTKTARLAAVTAAAVAALLVLALAGCGNPLLTGVSAQAAAEARTVYGIGEPFDPAGWVITFNYEGSTETVAYSAANATKFSFSALDSAAPGAGRSVTVTYEGKSTAITGLSVYPFVGRSGSGTAADPYTWTGYNSLATAFRDAAGRTVTITLYRDDTPLAPGVFYTLDAADTGITLIGYGGERTISRAGSNGSDGGTIITAGSSTARTVSLTLGNNITLRGAANPNYVSGAAVRAIGSVTMLPGSRITGHYTSGLNGAVEVVNPYSSFTMKGGEITGNQITGTTSQLHYNLPAAVMITDGAFIMEGGSIRGNTVSGAAASSRGQIGIFSSNTALLVLRGDARIESASIRCSTATGGNSGKIAVSPNWTGSVGEVNFVCPGNTLTATAIDNDAAVATIAGAWNNREFLIPDPDAEDFDAITEAETARFTLGYFYGRKGTSANTTEGKGPAAGCRIALNPSGGASLAQD